MLINEEEYRMMYEAEEKLWWYKILHEKVLTQIQNKFGENKSIIILDAGCGTGGLMTYLIAHGYKFIEGFDYSDDAVKFCKARNLNVQKLDITNFDTAFENNYFDVIINNDVVYQFENEIIKNIFKTFSKKLKLSSSIIITNNNSFNLFYGIHDIAVGGKQRFTKQSFDEILKNTNLKISFFTYWSFFLSPLILLVRTIQRIQIKLNLLNLDKIKSDVHVPHNIINDSFYKIVKFEESVFSRGIFGSSIFMVLNKH